LVLGLLLGRVLGFSRDLLNLLLGLLGLVHKVVAGLAHHLVLLARFGDSKIDGRPDPYGQRPHGERVLLEHPLEAAARPLGLVAGLVTQVAGLILSPADELSGLVLGLGGGLSGLVPGVAQRDLPRIRTSKGQTPSPSIRACYPFFLRRSLYLRQITGAARIKTFLNTLPTGYSSSRRFDEGRGC
jgi:hypothetical protein